MSKNNRSEEIKDTCNCFTRIFLNEVKLIGNVDIKQWITLPVTNVIKELKQM